MTGPDKHALVVQVLRAILESHPERLPAPGDVITIHLHAPSPTAVSNGHPIAIAITQEHIDAVHRQSAQSGPPAHASASDIGQPMNCSVDHQQLRANGRQWCPICGEML